MDHIQDIGIDSNVKAFNRRHLIWGVVIACGCLLSLLLAPIYPGGNELSAAKIGQLKSNGDLTTIAQFMQEYESENKNKAPGRLSDLIPYAGGNLEVFYLPNRDAKRPLDWSTNVSRIDQYGGYRLATDTSAGVLVYEKPGAWPDGTVGVVLIDGKVNRLSSEAFEKLQLK